MHYILLEIWNCILKKYLKEECTVNETTENGIMNLSLHFKDSSFSDTVSSIVLTGIKIWEFNLFMSSSKEGKDANNAKIERNANTNVISVSAPYIHFT